MKKSQGAFLGQRFENSSLLIVEDDNDIRLLLNHFFKDYVGDVVLAENGREALEVLKVREFDTIVSDIQMPSMDGIRFLSFARSLGHMTPFIVLTSHGDYQKALEALSLGAFDFLSKDSKRIQMTESVRAALQIGRLLNCSKNDREQERQLLKIYKEIAQKSEDRLRRIIENLKS